MIDWRFTTKRNGWQWIKWKVWQCTVYQHLSNLNPLLQRYWSAVFQRRSKCCRFRVMTDITELKSFGIFRGGYFYRVFLFKNPPPPKTYQCRDHPNPPGMHKTFLKVTSRTAPKLQGVNKRNFQNEKMSISKISEVKGDPPFCNTSRSWEQTCICYFRHFYCHLLKIAVYNNNNNNKQNDKAITSHNTLGAWLWTGHCFPVPLSPPDPKKRLDKHVFCLKADVFTEFKEIPRVILYFILSYSASTEIQSHNEG